MFTKILSNFYGCVVENCLTNDIAVWHSSTTAMARTTKGLQSMVKTAERITRSPLPSLHHIYHLRGPQKSCLHH